MNPAKNHLKVLLLIAGALALLALPAASADENDAAAKFKAMDTNGDGRISPAEFATGQQLMGADQDKAVAKPEKKHWWSRSSDTKTEDPAATTQQFTKLDVNGDGYLSEAEFAAGLETKK
jgi:Ca2+-binding EF-hand superfamily protein